MRRIIYILPILAMLLLPSFSVYAHQNIVENDTTVCPGTSLTFHGIGNTVVPLYIDDQFSSKISIGFPFYFYGTVYPTCVVSSNGYICFDTLRAGQYSPWSIPSGIPGNNDVKNSIMGHYADIYPPAGGVMDYAIVGQAPNRKFVVSFCEVPMFSCTTIFTTFQMVLNEADSTIDVHIRNKPTCANWNNGAAIEGVQDATGTYATVVPGRNYPGTWTATNSSHKFTPTSATSYSVTSIPFAPVVTNGYNFVWYQNNINSTPIGYTQNITVTPTGPGVTTYYLKSIHCADTAYDSVKVYMAAGVHIDSLHKTNPTTCGAMNGSIGIYGLTPNHSYQVYYTKNGIQQGPVSMFTNSSGVILLTGLGAGIYTNVYVTDAPCTSNVLGPVTLTNPSITANYNYFVKYGCSQDTVIFTNLSFTPGTLVYKWAFGDGTFDTSKNPVHIYTTQGTYNVRLIATNNSCADTVAKNINLNHPLHASFTVSKDSACSQQLVAFTNTSTATTGNGIPPQYFWDFADGTTSTQQSPTHTFLHAGTYHVRLVAKNFVPCYDTAYHTIVIDSIPFVNFTISDTAFCEGKSVLFTGHYLPIGNTGIEWGFSDGGYNINTNPVAHAFDSSGTFYIKLTAHYRLCPDTSYSATVTVHPYPNIDLGPDTAMCPGAAVIPLYDHLNSGTGGNTYLWNTGATTSAINVNAPGTYSATITRFGCSSSDTVEVLNDCYLRIPNTFTPNGDGVNDYFLPRQLLSRSVTAFTMNIYDRWGELIYTTSQLDGRGWDGKFNDVMQPEGVYIYTIDVSYRDGRKETYRGNVTMLR